jgi:hypothetical protein
MTKPVLRSFLEGRDAGQAVMQERELVVSQLLVLGLAHAAAATRATSHSSFHDFYTMRGLMLAGGLHRVRLYGGRSIAG